MTLAQYILASIVAVFNQGRYATIADIKAAGQNMQADGNAIGAAIDELAAANLIVGPPTVPEGQFGPTQAGLEQGNALLAQLQAPQQAGPAPAPAQAAPALAPQPQQAAKGGAKKGGAKKGGAVPVPGQQAAPEAQAGFTMQYKTMDKLTAQELVTRIEEWTLAAEANAGAGQTIVAEGLMRTVSRAQRRLRNLTNQAQQ